MNAKPVVVIKQDDESSSTAAPLLISHPPKRKALTSRLFLLVFLLQSVANGMVGPLWVSAVSTVERRFQMQSQLVGTIAAVSKTLGMLSTLGFAQYGVHRPRSIALACLISALAAVCMAAPEMFTTQHTSAGINNVTMPQQRSAEELCLQRQVDVRECDKGDGSGGLMAISLSIPLILFVIAHSLHEIGKAGPETLGMPFLHDNVKLKNTPVYFALAELGPAFGPTLGFLVGSYTSSLYIDYWRESPTFDRTDPQWIGAWYLGFLPVALVLAVCGCAFLWFPRQIRKSTDDSIELEGNSSNEKRYSERGGQLSQTNNRRRGMRDLARDLWTLAKNPTILFFVIGRGFDGLGQVGYFFFKAKYLETYFHVSASRAAAFSGLSGPLAFTIAATFGSLFIRRYKPTPRALGVAILLTQAVYAFGYFAMAGVRCEDEDGSAAFADNVACNAQCACEDASFTPVCDRASGRSYFSPCRAGCAAAIEDSSGRQLFANCSCAVGGVDSLVERGFCSAECNGFYWYVAIFSATKFLAGLPIAGVTMIIFRDVEPELKALVFATVAVVSTLVGFVPGSVIMGSLIDASCIKWSGSTCSTSRRNCLQYDNRTLRLNFHLFTGAMRCFALVFDALVVWQVWRLKFHGEEKKKLRH